MKATCQSEKQTVSLNKNRTREGGEGREGVGRLVGRIEVGANKWTKYDYLLYKNFGLIFDIKVEEKEEVDEEEKEEEEEEEKKKKKKKDSVFTV